jgi:hypothetical protein
MHTNYMKAKQHFTMGFRLFLCQSAKVKNIKIIGKNALLPRPILYFDHAVSTRIFVLGVGVKGLIPNV